MTLVAPIAAPADLSDAGRSAGFRALRWSKERRKRGLFGLYVRPAARRRGVGAALIAAILGHAARLVEQVQLAVGAENAPARRLSARLGFVEWAVERRALKHPRRLRRRNPHGDVPGGPVTARAGDVSARLPDHTPTNARPRPSRKPPLEPSESK